MCGGSSEVITSTQRRRDRKDHKEEIVANCLPRTRKNKEGGPVMEPPSSVPHALSPLFPEAGHPVENYAYDFVALTGVAVVGAVDQISR